MNLYYYPYRKQYALLSSSFHAPNIQENTQLCSTATFNKVHQVSELHNPFNLSNFKHAIFSFK